MSKRISNEFKIGLMAVIVIALAFWGYKFLRGKNILKTSNNYFVRYDNIDQLAASSPVLIRGITVGIVAHVKLDDDMRSIIATLDIDNEIRIPKDAVALIVSTSIMGGKAVELKISGACEGDECAKPGDFIEGRVQGFLDSFLPSGGGSGGGGDTNVSNALMTLADSLTSPYANNEIAKTYTQLSKLIRNLASITSTLDKSMSTYDLHLQNSLANIETITGVLARNQDKIASSLVHMESLTRQLDEADFGKTTENLNALVDDAQVTFSNLNKAVNEAQHSFTQLSAITSDLQNGKGSLGKLMKDNHLYDNLTLTTHNLNLLLQDFRLNPKRYVNVSVFGKKQKEYEVPEDDPAFQSDTIK